MVTNIIQVGSDMRSVAFKFGIVFIVLIMGSFFYIEYGLNGPCKRLEKIHLDPTSESLVRDYLQVYINRLKVQDVLRKSAGLSFSVLELESDFDFNLKKIKLPREKLEIFVRSRKKNKSFDSINDILQVGIGYARSYLIFDATLQSSSDTLQLGLPGQVVCQ